MIDQEVLLKVYSTEMYSMYSTAPEFEWGNIEIARRYLRDYYIDDAEYGKVWKPILYKVFVSEYCSLPDVMFKEGFSMIPSRGGILFTPEEFEKLRQCMAQLGDQHLIIVQNTFGISSEIPPFRMRFPANITWQDISSGNFISTVLLKMFANEYFVFSESGQWGKYSANDYEYPLDIIGYRQECETIFKPHFTEELNALNELEAWLPPSYRQSIKPSQES